MSKTNNKDKAENPKIPRITARNKTTKNAKTAKKGL